MGVLEEVPEGQKAPGNHELKCDYWEMIGDCPPGGAESLLNEDTSVDQQLTNRHIMIRGENVSGQQPHLVLSFGFNFLL